MQKALTHLKTSDPILASIIERVGAPQITYRDPTFEALARSIVFQQLSTKAARTIYGRLEEAAGGKLTPESIQGLSVGEMRRAGLSKQKIGYIRDLAEHALSGKVDFARLPEMTDEEVIATLTDIKGVGVWTAHMFLIFALRRPNVLAVGDLGVRTAIKRHYKKRVLPNPANIEKLAANWHPYCSYACWYLWRSLEFPKNGKPTTKTTTPESQNRAFRGPRTRRHRGRKRSGDRRGSA
jgi:DNA-3-methyladenine glycosylase II